MALNSRYYSTTDIKEVYFFLGYQQLQQFNSNNF